MSVIPSADRLSAAQRALLAILGAWTVGATLFTVSLLLRKIGVDALMSRSIGIGLAVLSAYPILDVLGTDRGRRSRPLAYTAAVLATTVAAYVIQRLF